MSYYEHNWGFCLPHQQIEEMKTRPQAVYEVSIDSELKPGQLNYGELVIPGEHEQEVLISSYLCHPSMANNELSGPAVMTAVARWVSELSHRWYSYRFLYSAETVGTITYLSRNLQHLKDHVIAGFVLSCVGDQRAASYVSSREGNNLADRVAKHVMRHHFPDLKEYSYLQRGSDERQYCSRGVDLPVCMICRSKFGAYPEYHTSDDNLELVTAAGFSGSLEVVKDCIRVIENNEIPLNQCLCEPQLGKRGLYPNTSTRTSGATARSIKNLIAYSDGRRDLVGIAESIGESAMDLIPILKRLKEEGIVECRRHDPIDQPNRTRGKWE